MRRVVEMLAKKTRKKRNIIILTGRFKFKLMIVVASQTEASRSSIISKFSMVTMVRLAFYGTSWKNTT